MQGSGQQWVRKRRREKRGDEAPIYGTVAVGVCVGPETGGLGSGLTRALGEQGLEAEAALLKHAATRAGRRQAHCEQGSQPALLVFLTQPHPPPDTHTHTAPQRLPSGRPHGLYQTCGVRDRVSENRNVLFCRPGRVQFSVLAMSPMTE